ncbi:hypothetical protein DFJ73DRAFT_845179 [Zopfochytrium polystomum]|nr:hypothetical protein DFJ73DRAFT_845179 [Zopfochytrium polystomum]
MGASSCSTQPATSALLSRWSCATEPPTIPKDRQSSTTAFSSVSTILRRADHPYHAAGRFGQPPSYSPMPMRPPPLLHPWKPRTDCPPLCCHLATPPQHVGQGAQMAQCRTPICTQACPAVPLPNSVMECPTLPSPTSFPTPTSTICKSPTCSAIAPVMRLHSSEAFLRDGGPYVPRHFPVNRELSRFLTAFIKHIWHGIPLDQTKYAGGQSPDSDLFVYDLLCATSLSLSIVLLGIRYVHELKVELCTSKEMSSDSWGIRAKLRALDEQTLFVASLMIAMKSPNGCCNTFTNQTWSKVSNLPLQLLNELEMSLCHALGFDLWTREDDYMSWLEIVEKAALKFATVTEALCLESCCQSPISATSTAVYTASYKEPEFGSHFPGATALPPTPTTPTSCHAFPDAALPSYVQQQSTRHYSWPSYGPLPRIGSIVLYANASRRSFPSCKPGHPYSRLSMANRLTERSQYSVQLRRIVGENDTWPIRDCRGQSPGALVVPKALATVTSACVDCPPSCTMGAYPSAGTYLPPTAAVSGQLSPDFGRIERNDSKLSGVRSWDDLQGRNDSSIPVYRLCSLLPDGICHALYSRSSPTPRVLTPSFGFPTCRLCSQSTENKK